MKGNFNTLINSNIPVLVDFFAEWCQPCKVQSPILQELAREMNGKIKVLKIDIDKNPAIAEQFSIQGVPTLMLFKEGNILWRQSGVTSRQSLLQVICSSVKE